LQRRKSKAGLSGGHFFVDVMPNETSDFIAALIADPVNVRAEITA